MRTPRFLLTGLAVVAPSVARFGQVGHALAETYPRPPAWRPDARQGEHLRRSITLMDQNITQKRNTIADSPDTSPAFRPEALIEVALCIGGRNDEPGEGIYTFDDFQDIMTQ